MNLNPYTVMAVAMVLLGLIGLVLLASAAPWPLTVAVVVIFAAAHLSGSARR
jgi:hypothetical protein